MSEDRVPCITSDENENSVSEFSPINCDSRIRRNLSIHIARLSASESPRAIYQLSQNSPIFAGSKLIARGDALCARLRMRQHPKHHSLSARICDQLFITARALFHLFLPILYF